VVVSAHLDDAVLSASRALGRSTLVVTVFAGLPRSGVLGDWDADGGAADSRERMRERRREDAAALERFGAGFVHLDVLAAQYVRRTRERGALTARIAADLAPLLATHAVYAPAGIGHPEHAVVRDAVLSVRPDATLYSDLPYAAHGATGLQETHPVRRRAVLGARELHRKTLAVRCYASQLELLRALFGPVLTRAMLGSETYWTTRR